MVFSLDTIKKSTEVNITESKSNRSEFNQVSFFIETMNTLTEESFLFESMVVREISMGDILKYGIKKIDYKKVFKTILDKFVELLDKLWNRFHSLLLEFINKNIIIKKYKSVLENVSEPVEFDQERFIYTNLGLNTSYTSYKNELEKEFSNLILDLSKFHQYTSYDKLFDEIEKMKNDIEMSETFYDEIRGNVVGSRNPISKSEFPQAMYKYFRNNGYKVSSISISPNEIKEICYNYFNYNKIIKEIQKDKSDMQKAARKIQADIKSINLSDYTNLDLYQEAQKVFMKVLENKSRRVYELCNIYLEVFSMKLDAVKESYNQYKNILFFTCKSLVKEGKI